MLFAEALLQGRPLSKGERRDNGDGSYSTEVSVTVPMSDGRWGLIPSLWMLPDGAMVEFQEDEAAAIANEYERRQQGMFPRFGTPEDAGDYAQQRSMSGGRGDGSLFIPLPRKRPYAA